MDFRERYKRIGFGREDIEINRALRSQRRDEARREMRNECFNIKRGMNCNWNDSLERKKENMNKTKPMNPEEEAKKKAAADLEAAVQKRFQQLMKWREERNRRRIQEKKRAKPVFKVGVVHHRMYSPPLTKNPTATPITKLCRNKENQPEVLPKRVTRATEKRLAIKSVTNHQKRENLKNKKTTVKITEEIPVIPKDHQFKAPIGIIPLPMFGRHALESTNENMELDLNLNTSFSNSEACQNSSYNSNHIFSSTTHSSILPTLTDTCINQNYNTDPCEKSNQSLNDSMNNSSVEAISLKISFDDQEILKNEQNTITDCKIDTSFKKNTRSTTNKKNSLNNMDSTIERMTHSMESKEIVKDQNNVTSNLSKKSEIVNKRSTRLTNRAAGSTSQTDDVHSIVENRKGTNTQKNIHSTCKSPKLNSSFSKQKKTKLFTNRKKSNKISTDETVSINNAEMENSFPLENQKILNNNSDSTKNASPIDSANLNKKKSKSSKISNRKSLIEDKSINDSVKQSDFILDYQESSEEQLNSHSKGLNLMDSSIIDQQKMKSHGRKKVTKVANEVQKYFNELQDESLIKFSPRRSLRQQTEKASKSASSMVVETSPKLLPNDQTNFSWLAESLNVSTISEPVKRKTLDKKDDSLQNFSLNLSITKESLLDKPPAYFSPYIVTSRGKSSVRKEIQRHCLNQSSPTEIPTKDTVMQSLNISVEEEERTAQYYKYILNQEIDRLNERCDFWNVVKDDDTTPEEIRDVIQAAVGQTKLLINKKFERFRSLVLDCETGKGEMLVTCKDLQGFWDMMYMEIKDCDNRFNKLEELKRMNWIDKETQVKDTQQLHKKKSVATKRIVNKKKTLSTKPSSLRAHIMAARKKQIGGGDIDVDVEMHKEKDSRNSSVKSAKKIARRTSTPKSSNKLQPLIKKLSQSQKATTSPLIVMKLSQMCKTPEIQLDDSIVYVNSGRTPAKSILKSSKDDLIGFTGKSSNKVLFKEQPMEFYELENNKSSNGDQINKCVEPIERKLNFESDSFNTSHTEDEEESNNLINFSHPSEKNTVNNTPRKRGNPKIIIREESNPLSPMDITAENSSTKYLSIPKSAIRDESIMLSVSPLTLMDSKVEDSSKKATKTKKQISFKEDLNESYSRNLRSRKFTVPLTPRLNLKSSMKKVDEDLSMEVNDSIQEYTDNSPCSTERNNQLKELYLNADGIICQRSIVKKKNILNTPKLKRSNSDIQEIVSPVIEIANENKKSSTTPRVRRNTKKSLIGTELREDNANISVEEITKITLNRTTKALNSTNNINKIDNIEYEKNNIKKTSSTPINRKLSLKNISKQIVTPNSKRRNSKRFTENLEGDIQQTDLNNTIGETLTPNRRKSLRIARVNTKKED